MKYIKIIKLISSHPYHSSDISTNGISLNRLRHPSSGLINLNQVNLDGGVILGADDAVAGRAT